MNLDCIITGPNLDSTRFDQFWTQCNVNCLTSTHQNAESQLDQNKAGFNLDETCTKTPIKMCKEFKPGQHSNLN